MKGIYSMFLTTEAEKKKDKPETELNDAASGSAGK